MAIINNYKDKVLINRLMKLCNMQKHCVKSEALRSLRTSTMHLSKMTWKNVLENLSVRSKPPCPDWGQQINNSYIFYHRVYHNTTHYNPFIGTLWNEMVLFMRWSDSTQTCKLANQVRRRWLFWLNIIFDYFNIRWWEWIWWNARNLLIMNRIHAYKVSDI